MSKQKQRNKRRRRKTSRTRAQVEAAEAAAAPVLAHIREAFAGVLAPDREHRSLRQADAWDDYVVLERAADEHEGPWEQLPDATIDACQYALPHLDEQGIHYYLPAIMRHYLRYGGRQNIHHSLLYTLTPSTGELKDYQWRRLSLLSFPQRAAILAFLEYIEADEDLLRTWRRVVDAGDTRDWLRKLF